MKNAMQDCWIYIGRYKVRPFSPLWNLILLGETLAVGAYLFAMVAILFAAFA